MSQVTMTLTLDSQLQKAFTECVLRNFPDLDEGIRELMRVYVEKTNGRPHQAEIRENIKQNVFAGDRGSGLDSRDIEKKMLNKTDEDIEANRLA